MWNDYNSENTDVVLYTKVGFSRNVRGYNFPSKMSTEDSLVILSEVEEFSRKAGLKFVRTESLSKEARLNLVTNGNMPINMARNPENTAFVSNEDESVNLLVNGMDHFLVQSICQGYNVEECYSKAEKLTVELEKNFDIAYSERMGFLTASPKSLGTGLSISFLVSIPGIERGGIFSKLQQRLNSCDWEIFTLVDSPTRIGSLYVIRNHTTLGVSETKTIERAITLINDVLKVEKSAREVHYKRSKLMFEDNYYRAYGILKYCRKIDVNEALDSLGWLRMGNKLIEEQEVSIDLEKIIRMTDRIWLSKKVSNGETSEKGNELRAQVLRAIMEGDNLK